MRRYNLKRAAAFFLAAAVVTVSGCVKETGRIEADVKEEKQGPVIGMTVDSFVIERWIRDRDIFVSAAMGMGAEVNVQNANGSALEQISQIEYFIKKQMDVIVVIAVDCQGLQDVLLKAREAGIKIICYDRLVQNANCDLYISFNNEEVGRMMAANLVENIPEGGDIFLIQGPLTDNNVKLVRKGIDEVLKDSNLNVVYEANCEGWLAEDAFTYVKEGLKKNRNIKGIICGNDDLASHAFRALSEERLAGKVYLTGQDGDLAACQRIVEGTQEMTAFKSVEEEASIAARCAVLLYRGVPMEGVNKEMYDGSYDVPYLELMPAAVTRENMDDVIIKGGFHSKEDVYLNVEH